MSRPFIRYSVMLLLLLLQQVQPASAQYNSNAGDEFWICFPRHTPSGSNQARLVLYISANCGNASGEIKVGNYVDSFFIDSTKQFIEKEIPVSEAYLFEVSTVADKGIRIRASGKIKVYAHIFAGVRSASYMALPVQHLGNRYFSCNYTQRSTSGSTSQFQIVATEDNTRVRITPRAGSGFLPPVIVDMPNAGGAYQYVSSSDLSGSEIESIPGPDGSCKNIAVFSGSSGTSILSALCNGPDSFDPLVQQLFPVYNWGRSYLLAPFSLNPAGYHVRVIAAEDNTTVSFDGVQQAVLNKGEMFPPINTPQLPQQGELAVTADKPVSVAQYLLSEACTGSGIGDPDMILATPIAAYGLNRTVYTSRRQNITSQYIKIVAPTFARDSFRLNNAPVNTGWTAIPGAPQFSYNNIQVPVADLAYKITSGDTLVVPFDVQVYGLGDAESYAYPGGTFIPVAGVSVDLVQINQTDRDENALGYVCPNTPFNIYLHSPFPVTKIQWELGALGGTITESSPLFVSSAIVGEKTFYIYKLAQQLTGTTAGTYKIDVKFEGTYPGNCKKQLRTFINLQVFEKSYVQARAVHDSCLKTPVRFIGINPMQCNPSGNCDQVPNCSWATIDSWFWDFGDGNTSYAQSPLHQYQSPGTYTATLRTTARSKCPVDPVFVKVVIDTLPTANFGYSAPYCEKKQIVFTDSSRFYNITDTLKEWYWDMGDGTTFTRTSAAAFAHTYTDTGLYIVKLAVKNKRHCPSDTIKKAIYIGAAPDVHFGFTDACLNDPFVQFTDSSTIKDKTESSFSWLWTFGDPAATPGNPNTSTLQNPTHQYTLAGTFPVSLTVTSGRGCSVKKDTVITISSAPSPDFRIASSNQFCSNIPVELTNLSTNATGSIRRLDIYWDVLNNPSVVTTDAPPAAGGMYTHSYGAFSNVPAAKNYAIELVVLTGQTCTARIRKDITLHAMPKTVIDPLKKVCSDTNFILLTEGRETTGLSGTGSYFGSGITPGGQFAVRPAGAGTYTIGYAWLSSAGCTDTAYNSLEVVPSPTINAGPDVTVPDDGQYTFSIAATGNISTWRWLPPLYLGNTAVQNATVIRPQTEVLYTVKGTTPDGCTATDQVNVKISKGIAIPNTFTPNNDGINDFWLVDNLPFYTGCRVQVFTRTGQKVFESTGYKKPWDGSYKGKPLTSDTYYYIIELNNGKPGITGYVMIVR